MLRTLAGWTFREMPWRSSVAAAIGGGAAWADSVDDVILRFTSGLPPPEVAAYRAPVVVRALPDPPGADPGGIDRVSFHARTYSDALPEPDVLPRLRVLRSRMRRRA